MAYQLDESRTAVNWMTGAQAGRGNPTEILIHHWGLDGQTHDGVVNFFCTTAPTSCHYVASAGRVSCLVSPDNVSYHAGDWAVNVRSIGIECRPEATDGDYATIAELIRDIRATYGDLPLAPHQRYAQTACPGRYDLSRLDREARAGTKAQSGDITPITPSKPSAAPQTLEEMDIDMATPEQVAEAVWSKKITVDGQEARALDWLVAIVKEVRQVPKKGDVLTAFDGKTKARVVDILANLGPDVRAIKAVTDKQAKK